MYLLLLLLLVMPAHCEEYLTPFDFGLATLDHNRIDFVNTPPNILVANFNADDYPDIARFSENTLEIFLCTSRGYPVEPQITQYYEEPISNLSLDGPLWSPYRDLAVTLTHGDQKIIPHNGMGFDFENSFPATPPDKLFYSTDDAELHKVWESEGHPWGVDVCAVDDIDNDGITELITWYKPSHYALDGYVLIYKCTGDNQFTLEMEEQFWLEAGGTPFITSMMIDDLDQNGDKELIFTADKLYVWEFEGPGIYYTFGTTMYFQRAVSDVFIGDLDQDNVKDLSFITSSYGSQPPCMYQVEEFWTKQYTPTALYAFHGISEFWQNWIDARIAVGDFNNDGVNEIVSGNYGWGYGYVPIDIQFFRYEETGPPYLSQQWLVTNEPLTCANPLILDIDEDGDNELFCGGLYPNGASAFLCEATSPTTARATWIDTVSIFAAFHRVTHGLIDEQKAIVASHIDAGYPDGSYMTEWWYSQGEILPVWESDLFDTLAYRTPIVFDTDNDNKQNVTIAAIIPGTDPNYIHVWEQVSSAAKWDGGGNAEIELSPISVYPNPFNAHTTISFDLPAAGVVELNIFDITGSRVGVGLAPTRINSPSTPALTFDGSNLPSGVYLYRVEAGNFQETGKLFLMK
ncbi:MAG: T9SS type A sorting domain-containing protein [bacterium]